MEPPLRLGLPESLSQNSEYVLPGEDTGTGIPEPDPEFERGRRFLYY